MGFEGAVYWQFTPNIEKWKEVRERSADEAKAVLVEEGYDPADVDAVIGSMIANTTLDLAQPDEGYLFTETEVQTLRDQLNS